MIFILGISHKTAPIEVREKLAFSPEDIPDILTGLKQAMALEEIALLSTCNRTEIYARATSIDAAIMQKMIAWWHQRLLSPTDIRLFTYFYENEKAVQHLMRVACGLDSMILGEPQILGQLKSAFRIATISGGIGKNLSRLFQSSFSVAKKIRTHTGIATHPVSVAFAAVTLAKQIFSDLSQTTVVLLGAGENTELVLQHLLSKPLKQLFVVNRTLSHGVALAQRYGAKAYPLTELSQCLKQADIVISSMACNAPLVTQSQVDIALKGTKRRPILMVDLGVPRNIESLVGKNEDIYLYTIDDLQGIITQNIKHRQIAAKNAESMIEDAMQAYIDWMRMEAHMQAVRTLRMKVDVIKEDMLKDALRQLEKGQDPKKLLAHIAHQLTQKLLHEPTVSLRKMSYENADEKIAVAKELFSIE